ncbi:hypothetical protein BpHYR1_022560 [Brachionus plicatilis]|uniref:Uncharacterized protein n=1 Tax=Brachionus plicatilis TaxID=10195 RepID=A0A3M7PXB9_BRAPC|nr:hypothetical protein BpHYR1_022560 [Brachionus plicatilis]
MRLESVVERRRLDGGRRRRVGRRRQRLALLHGLDVAEVALEPARLGQAGRARRRIVSAGRLAARYRARRLETVVLVADGQRRVVDDWPALLVYVLDELDSEALFVVEHVVVVYADCFSFFGFLNPAEQN